MAKIEVTLGIDIGGTNTVLGFVTRTGSILAESSMTTNAAEPADLYVVRLHVKIKEMLEKVDDTCELKGIGIGAPNANYYKGTVEFPPNLKWEGVTELVKMIQQYYNVPVAITNDANAAAIGEMKFGAGIIAAQKFGAKEIVDPRKYAVKSIVETYRKYPNIGTLLPAMGYGDKQIKDLETTINRVPCDAVIIATPIDLRRLVKIKKPTVRVSYNLQEIGKPDLTDIITEFIKKKK